LKKVEEAFKINKEDLDWGDEKGGKKGGKGGKGGKKGKGQ